MPVFSEKALLHLISQGETTTLELKLSAPRAIDLAERLCGLANSQGGLIVMGVKDVSLEIVGVRDTSSNIDTILRATRLIRPVLVLNPPEPEVYILEDGRKLVVARVLPSDGPIYQSSGVAWVRRGTHTIKMSVGEMLELANDRGLVKWELQIAGNGTATLEDIDFEKVEAYLTQRRTSRQQNQSRRFEDLTQVLFGMKCVTKTKDGELRPTNAGILFFGKAPQFYIPQAEVVCVLYKDELGIGNYVDRWIVEGTVQELIDETETFLTRYIPVGAKIENWKRLDLPEYPLEALREAVVNAVVHRDYSREGESIRIFYYSNRIEVHSPGLLLPGITITQMERAEVMSKLRNPTLGNLLRDIPGYMERIGSGIRLMLVETQRMGLPAPEFQEISEFVVTFRKTLSDAQIISNLPDKSADPTLSSVTNSPGPIRTTEAVSQNLISGSNVQAEDANKLQIKQPLHDPEMRLQIAMRLVRETGYVTNRQLREKTGASEQTTMRDLETLVEQGLLLKVGKTRARRYRLR